MKRWLVTMLIAVLFVSGNNRPAKAAYVNDGFDPDANGTVRSMVVQSDGKILVGGDFTTIGGQARNHIARLNPDGRPDAFFKPDADFQVNTIAVQEDGKILVGGQFTTIGGQSRNRIARLNADGTLDSSFNPDSDHWVESIVVQSDGRILVGGSFLSMGGQSRNRIARLNADGTLDAAFNPDADSIVQSIGVQSDGKILVGGYFTSIGGEARNHMARLNPDGTLDAAFDPDVNGKVLSMAVRVDGKIFIGGEFTAIGGQTKSHIALLNDDGTLDNAFTPDADYYVSSIVIQPDGRILLGGGFASIGGQARNHIARFNPDGTVEAGFDPDVSSAVRSIAIQPDGKIVVVGDFITAGGHTRNHIARLNADGTVEVTFNPATGYVYDLAVQSDGKILAGGQFTSIGGQARNNIARLNPDGTVDSFNPDADGIVRTMVVQPDGKILVGGRFTTIGGQTRRGLARLNSDGTADSFDADIVEINSGVDIRKIAVQSDGKILIGIGGLVRIGGENGTAMNHLARLNPNGELDAGFTPDPNNSVYAIAVQSDGKILVGGSFFNFSDIGTNDRITRERIARLNIDGRVDEDFNAGATNQTVYSIIVLPDGKILAGGNFSQIGGQTTKKYLVRLNADGTVDDAFNAQAGGFVYTMARQSDGKILVGGSFNGWAGWARDDIARVYADGALDTGFDPYANGTVWSLVVQSDGKILVGGSFTKIDGLTRKGIARLSADDAAFQELSVSDDGATITWKRSQSSPEVHDVTFRHSYDSSDWTYLGAGARIEGGWELTGQSLPFNTLAYVRAMGDTGNSTVESVRQYYLDNTRTLSITKNGTGSGTVTSSPAGIDCGPDCSEDYEPGEYITYVTLTATPDAGATFAGWSGDADCSDGVVAMDADKGCTATFDITEHTLTVTTIGPGSVSGSGIDCGGDCDEPYPAGMEVYLTANPEPGALFKQWSGDCTGSPYSTTCTVIMDADRAVTAEFYVEVVYLLEVIKEGTGSGTVTSNPVGINCGEDCKEPYAPGMIVNLAADPEPDSTFAGWRGRDADDADCEDGQVTMDADKECIAAFTLSQHTVTPSAGANGSISPNTPQIVNHGSTAQFTITPNAGYHIDSVGGTCGGVLAGNTYTTNAVTAHCSVDAAFAPGSHTLTVARLGPGTGTVTSDDNRIDCGMDCEETYGQGTVAILIAVPDPGWLFGGWIGACSGTGSCQVTMDTDHEVSAIFTRPDYGDAVDSTETPIYPSLYAHDGAGHLIIDREWLGMNVDGEDDSVQTNSDLYDDGVQFKDPDTGEPALILQGATVDIEITVSVSDASDAARYDASDPTRRLYLNAWFDWNGDGDWNDPGEKVIGTGSGIIYPGYADDTVSIVPTADFAPGENSGVFLFRIIPAADWGYCRYARFRLDYGEDAGSIQNLTGSLDGETGAAVYGEVEDYRNPLLARATDISGGTTETAACYDGSLNLTEITIPGDTFAPGHWVNIAEVGNPGDYPQPPSGGQAILLELATDDETFASNTDPARFVTIRVPHDPAAEHGETVQVYWWDAINQEWSTEGVSHVAHETGDPHFVSFDTFHFTTFLVDLGLSGETAECFIGTAAAGRKYFSTTILALTGFLILPFLRRRVKKTSGVEG